MKDDYLAMLRIFLARHGQNLDNARGILNGRRDEPLTDLGIAQARVVADKIRNANLHFEHIYCSPLSRAADTAAVIAETVRGPEPVVWPELTERDFGAMTGQEQSRIAELCAPDIVETGTITYFLRPSGAETFPDLLTRAEMLLDKLRARHKDGDVLLVTHGDFGKMIYAKYYSLDWRDVLMLFHFGNSELLLLSEDSNPDQAHVFEILQHNL